MACLNGLKNCSLVKTMLVTNLVGRMAKSKEFVDVDKIGNLGREFDSRPVHQKCIEHPGHR